MQVALGLMASRSRRRSWGSPFFRETQVDASLPVLVNMLQAETRRCHQKRTGMPDPLPSPPISDDFLSARGDLFAVKPGEALPNKCPFTDASASRLAVLAQLSIRTRRWRKRFGILGARGEIREKFGTPSACKQVDKCSLPQVCRTG